MNAFYTILLLIVSNIFMTFAWYGHLKLQETKVTLADRGKPTMNNANCFLR